MNGHIDHHFDEALLALKQQISLMAGKVKEMLADCISALNNKDRGLAEKIIEADNTINALEISIDEQCIHLLARYQPVAADLRFITRGLKIVTDLERIGDLVVNSAQRVIDIIEAGGEAILDLNEMSITVQKMLQKSIDAFINGNVSLAEEVLKSDDKVDEMTERFIMDLIKMVESMPTKINIIFPTTSIIRYLERIGDHSTNIAELAIYMIKGRDIRHGKPL